MEQAGAGVKLGLVLAGCVAVVPLAVTLFLIWFEGTGGFSGGSDFALGQGETIRAFGTLLLAALPLALVVALWVYRVRRGHVPLVLRVVGWVVGVGPLVFLTLTALFGTEDGQGLTPGIAGGLAAATLPYALGIVGALWPNRVGRPD